MNMNSLIRLNRLGSFLNKNFGLLSLNSCVHNSHGLIFYKLSCNDQTTLNHQLNVRQRVQINNSDGHFLRQVRSDTKCCAQVCDLQLRSSSSDSKSSPTTSEKRSIGSLSATLVDNSSNSIKPYLQLMRLDRPIGKKNIILKSHTFVTL